MFGHEFRGRGVESRRGAYSHITSKEGAAKVTVGTSFSATGVSWIDGDFICSQWEAEIEAACAAVFRNPAGTPEKQNEFAWITPWDKLDLGCEVSVSCRVREPLHNSTAAHRSAPVEAVWCVSTPRPAC